MLKPKYVELQDLEVLYVRKTGDYMVSCGKAWEVLMALLINKR
jgi:hypothetical protein